MSVGKLLWQPDPSYAEECELSIYKGLAAYLNGGPLESYEELWHWSIKEKEAFWESLFDYFELMYDGETEPVLTGSKMPDFKWFPNVRLNFAENLTRLAVLEEIALISIDESGKEEQYTWRQLLNTAAQIQQQLKKWGLEPGDRVCGVLPNSFLTSASFLAVSASGYIWSCCSPDFGGDSIVDRFRQIEPKVLLTVDEYGYGGKIFDLKEKNEWLGKELSTLQHSLNLTQFTIDDSKENTLEYIRLPFSAPLWVLYSSGTTGAPKAITHSHGGVLLELNKYHAFHNDVKSGELFFWYTTTGWMMWNFLHGAWLRGAKILVYDGSPGYPEVDFLWKLAEKYKINHFGTSAPYILANRKAGMKPIEKYDLSALRSIGSTGSPLPPEGFDYVYDSIKKDVWLTSMSGGTDVCTAFVGGNPTLPVYEGEIQCRTLGCALYCYDEEGKVSENDEGEMVITEPMPCMPVYFWNDENKERYKESYFEMYYGIWRHGDWIKITPRNGIIIYGRSDATLNKQGIRIGTSEIYRSLDNIPEIVDSLIVNIEKRDGEHFMPLFVILKEGVELDESIIKKIKNQLRNDYSPRHIPDKIIKVDELPYTLSGKKMETPIKKILSGRPVEKCVNPDTIRNPSSIDFFVKYALEISNNND